MPIVPVPSTVSSFRDALGLALELSDEFAFAHAVLVTDHNGCCVDFGVLTRFGEGLIPVLGWLSDRVERQNNPRNVILFTARTLDWHVVAERDLAEYRFAATIVNRLGLHLVDWIETDGEIVRSYAYLANPNTGWANQAAAEGVVDVDEW